MLHKNTLFIVVFFLFCSCTKDYIEIDQNPVRLIAHAGFWSCNNSHQNSISSLINAQENNFWASEFDVRITKDSIPIVFHNSKINNSLIENVYYREIENIHLPNGEKIPTLSEYLFQGSLFPNTMLFLEIKEHSSSKIEELLVNRCLSLIHLYKMDEQIVFISFSYYVCQLLQKKSFKNLIMYLGDDKSPSQLLSDGFKAVDYSIATIYNRNDWYYEARKNKMDIYIYTIDRIDYLNKLIEMGGVTGVTTNVPDVLKQYLCTDFLYE
jgi:glycerophosphoryl diester phosphodiesterase